MTRVSPGAIRLPDEIQVSADADIPDPAPINGSRCPSLISIRNSPRQVIRHCVESIEPDYLR